MGEFINICASHCRGCRGGLGCSCRAELGQSRSAGNPVAASQMTANLKGGASSGHLYQKKEKPISFPLLSFLCLAEEKECRAVGLGSSLPWAASQVGRQKKKMGWTSVL